MKSIFAITAGMLLGATGAAHAVYLNPHGTGQVLVFPYYTVNAGYNTLFSIVNTTASGKAVKLRFHEGRDGRDVLLFNVYLSAFDVWTAAVGPDGDGQDAPAAILTLDATCTVPAFPVSGTGQPKLIDFSAAAYSGANEDGGPTDLGRTREGHFDVIEMGQIKDHSPTQTAVTHVNGVPYSCNTVVAAWATGGYWRTDPSTDLLPPSGGLYGAEAIVNVAEGTLFAVNPEAIDGFSTVIQNTDPGSKAPDLNTAVTDPAGSATSPVTAEVAVNGRMVQAQYDAPENAISALFMAAFLYNEYVTDPSGAAQSDWLVTFPTKRFYVDPALVDERVLPFDAVFGTDQTLAGTSCSDLPPQIFDRNEFNLLSVGCGFSTCPPDPSMFPRLCYETNVLPVNNLSSVFGSTLFMGTVGSAYAMSTSPFASGHISLYMAGPTQRLLPASREGNVFSGLPALGFLAENFVNANVMPGVLSNYSGTYAHRTHVTCANSTNPQNACP